MNRFAGLMPSNEIKKEKTYKTNDGHSVTVQAGPNGWTVIWPDQGNNFKDNVADTEENFQTALVVVETYYPGITGDDYAHREKDDAYREKQLEIYNEYARRIVERIAKDMDPIYELINRFPTRKAFERYREVTGDRLSYEDKWIILQRHYDELVHILKIRSKNEFIESLMQSFESFFNTDNIRSKDIEGIVSEIKVALRYYDAVRSTAIKLVFHESLGGGPLSPISSAIYRVIKHEGDKLKKKVKFTTNVSFTIDIGYREYVGYDNNNENSYYNVKDAIQKEVKQYLSDTVIPLIKEKYEGISRVQNSVFEDSYTEQFVYEEEEENKDE